MDKRLLLLMQITNLKTKFMAYFQDAKFVTCGLLYKNDSGFVFANYALPVVHISLY